MLVYDDKNYRIYLQQLIIQGNEDVKPILDQLAVDDGNEKVFDDYFKLFSKVWDQGNIIREASLVTMDKRMDAAAPYNIFFNSPKHCSETKEQPYSISFTDLLCPSLGKLKCSLHITFMIEIWWLLSKYAERRLHKLPMTIIHGHAESEWPEKETMKTLYPDIDYHFVEIKGQLGCHHSKLSIFVYDDDSLRLVIGSANLYADDWDIYNQQLWISPKCSKLPEGSSIMDGESPTGFKLALLDYLCTYNDQNISGLQIWLDRVKGADFKEIKVALLFTVPGLHYPRRNGSLVHFLGHLLSRDCTLPAPKNEHNSWRVVAQTASLGLIGKTAEEWLTTNLLKALTSHKEAPYFPTLSSISKVEFSLIYPSVQDCLNGFLGDESAYCCMYDKAVKDAQPWLTNHQ